MEDLESKVIKIKYKHEVPNAKMFAILIKIMISLSLLNIFF